MEGHDEKSKLELFSFLIDSNDLEELRALKRSLSDFSMGRFVRQAIKEKLARERQQNAQADSDNNHPTYG